MHAMLARWIPPLEQSKFAAYVYAGNKDKKKAIGCRLFKVVKDNSDEIMNHIKKNVCSGRSLFSENVNILHFN